MRLAAIDIGSNSVRCTIVDVPVGGLRVTVDDEKAYTRLGRGTLSTGRLSDEAMADTLAALKRMLAIATEHGVTQIRAVATAAVRSAANGHEFVERVRRELGLDVEIISEEHEGRLAFKSASANVDMSGASAVVDIGGGSVEIVRASDGQVTHVASVPLGAVIMSERFHTVDPMPPKVHKQFVEHVARALANESKTVTSPVDVLVGSGGTVTAAAALITAHTDPSLTNVHACRISAKELGVLKNRLVSSSAKQRAAMKGMPASRIDLIVSGVVVLTEIVETLGGASMVVNAHGMREGIVIEMVEATRGPGAPLDRMRSVRELMVKYDGRVTHAEQVRRLSLELFDMLAHDLGLDETERPLLEAAALLHDIGYHISYEQHHKHSYQLVTQSELPGFTASERRVIAGIARYHKGSLPKSKHEAMEGMTAPDRATVSRMAAILRIADGLDRSSGQLVTGVDVAVGPDEVVIVARGTAPLDAETYGAGRKSDLFEQVWDRRVRVADQGSD